MDFMNKSLNDIVATLCVMNSNCNERSVPSYDHISLSGKMYPLINLDMNYVKKLIKDVY